MTVFYSGTSGANNLGWSSTGDKGALLSAFLTTNRSGDTLILEEMYDISGGTYIFPTNFTLAAKINCGWNITDATNDAGSGNTTRTFRIQAGSTLRNLKVRYPNAPGGVGYPNLRPVIGVDLSRKIAIETFGADILIEDCDFDGKVYSHILGNQPTNKIMRRNRFAGGYWNLQDYGPCTNMLIENNVFENAEEGYKTLRANGGGTNNSTIRYCVSRNNTASGIDLTGGWKNGIIEYCQIYNTTDGIDCKKLFENSSDFTNIKGHGFEGMIVRNCDFWNSNAFITAKTLQRIAPSPFIGQTAEFCRAGAVNGIRIYDCGFERSTYGAKVILYSEAYDIQWSGLTIYGPDNLTQTEELLPFASNLPQADVPHVSGKIGDESPAMARNLASRPKPTTVPFSYGQVSGGELPGTGGGAPPSTEPRFVMQNGVLKINTDLGPLPSTPVTVRATNTNGTTTATFNVTIN